ncbi:MAG: capsular biosynthesis protein [Pseudomonadota bacterium]
MTPPLKVLFLQGPPTAFWRELAAALEAAGHATAKVSLHLGDALYWRRPGATRYRGTPADWPAWLEAFCERERVTDILYFADRLPYHVAAAEIAERRGMRVWAIENGYLRPDWLTLEPFAMGRNSRFPRDPDRLRDLAQGQEAPDRKVRFNHGFLREAASDVGYNLAMLVGRPLYPHFDNDRYYPAIVDYLCWAPNTWRKLARRRECARVEALCTSGKLDYTLLAMQLQSDYQIRASSDYVHLSEMLEEVIGTLAAHADPARHLVVKGHPLDSGWENWPKVMADIARRHGVAERVHWLDGGHLGSLLRGAASVITVNSTVGLHSLRLRVPILTLGSAVYDIAGLTHQGGLATFWQTPEPVDHALYKTLETAMAARIQVRGSFYDPAGRRAAAEAITRRLEQPEIYWPG